jgi:hypothetical protein
MDGQRGKQLRRRHATESARFSEIRGLYNRVLAGQRAIRPDVAGDRRGTSAHKSTSRKGGGQ